MNFPFDRDREYPKSELGTIQHVIMSYFNRFTYWQRNSELKLPNTHDLHVMPLVMTITSAGYDNIIIAITFSDEKPEGGKCCICGCTDEYACFNPDYGSCWWVDRKHTLCSHCAIEDII